MSGRKYDVIPQNGDCSRENNVHTLGFETKSVMKTQHRYRTQYGKDPPADNAIRRWVKQFQETGSVLRRKGAGRPSISQEDVDRIQEAFSRSPQKSTRRASVQLGRPQTTVWRVIHSRLHLHAYWPRKPQQ
jgi:transposase